jgi:hypothetical protein
MKRAILAVLLALSACGADTDGAATSGTESGGSSGSCPNDLPASCPMAAPSYANDVAPILQNSCSPCHSSGGQAANKPLSDYADVYARRGAILYQLHACKMPPASAPQPTEEERAALLAWLVCGAPDN